MNSEQNQAVSQAATEIKRNGHLRSQLRRADSASNVFGLAEAHTFDKALRGALPWLTKHENVPDECLILIAHRIVKLPEKKDSDQSKFVSLAALLGGRDEQDRALSGLRFQRLMHARAGDDRLRQMRRALSMLKQPVHPFAVVDAYLDLHHPTHARRFANDYFNGNTKPAAQPPADSASDQGLSP